MSKTERPEPGQFDSHCTFCGTSHVSTEYPLKCVSCEQLTWRSPKPVVIVYQEVRNDRGERGFLAVRRGIPPQVGGLALPGGYVDWGEQPDEAALREFREEVKSPVFEGWVRLERVVTTLTGFIVFCYVAEGTYSWDYLCDKFAPDPEVQELVFVTDPDELCFQSHREFARIMGLGNKN
jgi:8-oxo-dGTP diphosphatase